MSTEAPALALSIPQFCTAHNLSRASFYSLQRDNLGPRVMRVGRRVLVSIEAAQDWRRRMESQAARDPS